MKLEGAVAVVTGAASGIGRALATALARDGGATVVVADLNEPGASAVAQEIAAAPGAGQAGPGVGIDVTDETAVASLIQQVESEIGPIELWCGNAGIAAIGGTELPDETWNQVWNVNLMAHVLACRHLLPRWLERGSGHLLVTASAAGLLTNLGTAPYAVTKHAAVAFAEWIAITHSDEGVRVSCLCPQGVRTPMTSDSSSLAVNQVQQMGLMEPDEVAAITLEGLRADRFLILPHPEVATYELRRAGDRDRWLSGMRKLQRLLRQKG